MLQMSFNYHLTFKGYLLQMNDWIYLHNEKLNLEVKNVTNYIGNTHQYSSYFHD